MDYLPEEYENFPGILVPQKAYRPPNGQAAAFIPLEPIRFSVNGNLGLHLITAFNLPIPVLDNAGDIVTLSTTNDRAALRIFVSRRSLRVPC